MNAYLYSRLHNPNVQQKFWCNKCDSVVVDSDDNTTGEFFVVFGHGYSAQDKDHTGNYTSVMFALCNPCIEEESENV